ncbi:hypothetical protein [Pseudofulvimonas gallinarii]|jgi:hypothetical protein|uniref:EfeO-type cupredoxin-like domain-containing protein n=1 Tax=Pseudofulvimonas gallinarii TaxID=634155 RepID=A0A4S3KX62_9GAMM|nr:hypothetical protein [Pseudofulvimonas gallinarii]TCS98201.1 hypothetical protein EDC25_10954 [Pseudofulvimonas gallinarii]THD13820.1 hypothetical protein B1808_06155 [Pseudofulvimonas gallinarii]
MIATLIRLTLIGATALTTGCGSNAASNACDGITFTPFIETVTTRLAVNRPVHARIHNAGTEPRRVTIAVQDAVGRRQLEGPFRIEAGSVVEHIIGAVTLDAGRSILELKARGFDFVVERCE